MDTVVEGAAEVAELAAPADPRLAVARVFARMAAELETRSREDRLDPDGVLPAAVPVAFARTSFTILPCSGSDDFRCAIAAAGRLRKDSTRQRTTLSSALSTDPLSVATNVTSPRSTSTTAKGWARSPEWASVCPRSAACIHQTTIAAKHPATSIIPKRPARPADRDNRHVSLTERSKVVCTASLPCSLNRLPTIADTAISH